MSIRSFFQELESDMSPFRNYAIDRGRLLDLKTIDAYGAESVNALIKKTGGTALHKRLKAHRWQEYSSRKGAKAQRRKENL